MSSPSPSTSQRLSLRSELGVRSARRLSVLWLRTQRFLLDRWPAA